ncbi:MAG: hypothetical protein E6K64_07855 [Nitrospirae bacterium]|nr:MAG: hypothetical protein E6K64_07855 [Nitrospirota bacterium]
MLLVNGDGTLDTIQKEGTTVPNRKRTLSFDEKKAAEAAFQGLPIDPAWSVSAQAIYFGILARTQGRNIVEEEVLEATVF